MRFADVIGQQSIKQRLVAMTADERVPHAMLFFGSEGSGALPLALAFAQYIICSGDKSNGDACGTCPACRKAQKLVHPDIHYVFPIVKNSDSDTTDSYLNDWRRQLSEAPYFNLPQWTASISSSAKKGTDTTTPSGKQALIAKDAAATIHAKLALKPYEANKQILILWLPELMNESTSNSILKILEEPPADTLFFLVSEDASSILPTILSRTQLLRIPPIDDADMLSALQSRLFLPADDAARIAHIAQGNFVAARNIISGTTEAQLNLALFKDMMRAAYARDVIKMYASAESFKKLNREQVKNALSYAQHLVRESFIMNLDDKRLNFLSADEEQFLFRFAPFIHVGNVERISALIDDTLAQVQQNAQIGMVMKSTILSLASLISPRNCPRPSSAQ